jgi:transcriptional regulator with XRE-family HTH domain
MRVKLHERLAKLRRQHGFTQQHVADRLGMSRGAYSNYELGSREPDAENLVTLAQLYDVTVDYLITGASPADSGARKESRVEESRVLHNVISREEEEFLKWVDENLESSFFYDFSKSPEESKRQMMETLKFLWEQEKKRNGSEPKE